MESLKTLHLSDIADQKNIGEGQGENKYSCPQFIESKCFISVHCMSYQID
jgi:hypothetical protein